MDKTQNEKPPPGSTDVAAWKQAIAEGQLGQMRLEAMVAAIQDLAPCADKLVLNALAKHLNDAMLAKLRSLVSTSYPNKGGEIIDQVHQQMWEALVKPQSADGKGLRHAFIPRLCFRLKDVLTTYNRRRRLDADRASKSPSSELGERDSAIAANAAGPDALPDPGSYKTAVMKDFLLDVETVLDRLPDERRRLVFRLWLDGSPFEPTQPNSIPEAMGISEKTARKWVAEITNLMKLKLGDKI